VLTVRPSRRARDENHTGAVQTEHRPSDQMAMAFPAQEDVDHDERGQGTGVAQRARRGRQTVLARADIRDSETGHQTDIRQHCRTDRTAD